MSKREDRTPLYKSKYSVRLSQLITTFGPGAIIDFIDQPLMTVTQSKWKSPDKIYEERLAKRLKVTGFIQPKDADSKYNVPFLRFPEWYYCPKCREFKPIKEWEEDYLKKKSGKTMKNPVCLNYAKHKSAVQLAAPSILVACKKGHIDDFPWVEWAHLKKKCICPEPKLKLISNSGSLGLGNLKIVCENCNAENTMEFSNNKNAFKIEFPEDLSGRYDINKGFKCKGKLQWKNKTEECDEIPQMVLRNASNIYFPKIESSLSIPPYSDKITSEIEESSSFNQMIDFMERRKRRGKLESFFKEDYEQYIEDISEEINMATDLDLVKNVVDRIINKKNEDNNISRNDYRYDEYQAFLHSEESSQCYSKDFKIERKDAKDYCIEEISNIVLVKRLREVRALVGFSRLVPPDNFLMGVENGNNKLTLIDLKEDCDNWYPGYEVRGEGIFIELNEEMINNWIDKNTEVKYRADILNKTYNEKRSNSIDREITPKFILLHTLAHLLIKEFSFQCGYSSTSLRERIYCDMPSDDYTMNGILIYTADSDSEGSLGGLVKQGEKENLSKLIIRAIKRAEWCSYDPVCSESDGQGVDNLNLSACYSCTLLPETSCEEFNTLLDRVMIVGKLDNKEIGFFQKYI